MVQISPEEVMARRRHEREIDRLDEMSERDRDIAGAYGYKHLMIPMADVYNLRRIAGILHGLATDMDVLSRSTTMRPRTIIMETRMLVDDANRRVREMTGKGKRKKPWETVDN